MDPNVVQDVPAGAILNRRTERICNPLNNEVFHPAPQPEHRMISGIDIPPPVIPAMTEAAEAQQRLLESP